MQLFHDSETALDNLGMELRERVDLLRDGKCGVEGSCYIAAKIDPSVESGACSICRFQSSPVLCKHFREIDGLIDRRLDDQNKKGSALPFSFVPGIDFPNLIIGWGIGVGRNRTGVGALCDRPSVHEHECSLNGEGPSLPVGSVEFLDTGCDSLEIGH